MNAVNSLVMFAVFWDAQFVRWTVWVGLVVLTVALLMLIRTRWGQSQPLGKCIVLSLVAHLLVGIYTTTVNIVTATVGSPDGKGIQVALIDGPSGDAQPENAGTPEPWESFTAEGADQFATSATLAPGAAAVELPPVAEPQRDAQAVPDAPMPPSKLPSLGPIEDAGPPAIATVNDRSPVQPAAKEPEPLDFSPLAEDKVDAVPPPEPQDSPGAPATSGNPANTGAARPNTSGATVNNGNAGDAGVNTLAGPQTGPGKPKAVPEALKLRVGDHAQVAKGHGATQETEASVNAALKWLAANQSAGGRWEARQTGAGAGRAADGQDRSAAGATADTGITGLSLLAFLAAGHTHLQGPHQTTVRRGLEYLISVQDANGSLGISQNMYERMYCHAMATCALSEAYAMSGDERLQTPVRRAIGFTIATQERVSGGWRYRPSDSGDTSQLGWQVMALKSAQLAGIAIPDQTQNGITRFLRSVTLGREGGLACYQPVRPIASRSMTAEALACRQFMGIVSSPAAQAEASGFVLQEPPGTGRPNFYYWYYATLSMYQLQGEPWQRWNEALQKQMLASQRHDGELSGSWDPDPVWGGCGGRAYSTSLGTLCLEVYYRFLPLHIEAAGRERRAK